MNRLFITADRGNIRAFRVREPELPGHGPRHLVELKVRKHGKQPLPRSARVTDRSGQFSTGHPVGMSHGEDHNSEMEEERRIFSQLAEGIEQIVNRESCKDWVLAAPKPIQKRISERLSHAVLQRLADTEDADLCKVPVKDLEARFLS